MSLSTTRSRLAASAAMAGGVLYAVNGALQLSGLHWTGTDVSTFSQHLSMTFLAAAIVLTLPAVSLLARHATGRLGAGRYAIAAGSLAVAFAATVSNIRGGDANWFAAVAGPGNALWVAGSVALAVSLYRTGRVPRMLAVGLVVAYLGAIPLSMAGGGIITGCYWLALGYLMASHAIEKRSLRPAFS